jgi:pyruvate,water dikinase
MSNILSSMVLQLMAPKAAMRAKYNAFKELLQNDRRCHARLAELEEIFYQDRKVDLHLIRRLHRELSDGVSVMVSCLNRMAPAAHLTLRSYYKKIDFYGRIALTAPKAAPAASSFILPVGQTYPNDLRTGGKGLHLSQLKHQLGLPVPEGFIVSTAAFQHFIEANHLRPGINSLLSQVDIQADKSLSATAARLQQMVAEAEVPGRLAQEITAALAALQQRCGAALFAVRSSAVSEDSAISFAGQYESVLQVGADRVLAAYKQVLASKYSANALYYRIRAGLLEEDTPMAVLVLEMIDSRLSGVVTSGGAAGWDHDDMVIHYTGGLGDKLVGGRCAPATAVIRREADGLRCHQQAGPAAAPLLPEKVALQLAAWARQIEFFFQAPQEIEWSLDRRDRLFLLQARAMLRQEKTETAPRIDCRAFPVLIGNGETASRGAACGPVHVIDREEQLAAVPAGAVLVTAVTPPAYVLVLHRVCAVVADQGSAAGHFASVAREAGVPVLVKTGNATALLAAGRMVTVCADLGRVFDGCHETVVAEYPPQRAAQSATPVHEAFARATPFIFPLRLVNPAAPAFVAENCRSLHDIIRFVHEKGLQAMFSQPGGMFSKKSAATRLAAPIPLQIYILDMDEAGSMTSAHEGMLTENDLRSVPLRALLRGLTHPGIRWRHTDHFDWKNFSEVTMAGGIVSSSDPAFASYAVVAPDYLNLNLRFGYHFVILDSLCGSEAGENHITLHFAGGGGGSAGIVLRLTFIAEILRRLGFAVKTGGDLLEGRLVGYDEDATMRNLDTVGRLLAATTLLDMVIRDEAMVRRMVENFMNGRYDFADDPA